MTQEYPEAGAPTHGGYGRGSDVPSAAASDEPLRTGVEHVVNRQGRRTKTVVVTGASAGVGRAIARAFGELGDRVVLMARGRMGLEGARHDVERAGGRAMVIPIDVSDEQAMFAAAERVEKEFGPIDVWVNNAMLTIFSPIRDMKPEEFRRVSDVTYLGYVWGTLAALKSMRPRNRGHIIQVGSALAYRGIPLQSAYCAAKHAVQGFCDSLRSELIGEGLDGITVTMIQLPAVNTPQFDWVLSRLPKRGQPVPPIYQPEIVAQCVAWASEHRHREIYLGYSAAKAIIGNKIAPGLADRYLGSMGFESQQTDEPEVPDRPHNLWQPLDEEVDYGAHGRFGSRSISWSPQFWAERHKLELGLTAGLLAAGALAAIGLTKALQRDD